MGCLKRLLMLLLVLLDLLKRLVALIDRQEWVNFSLLHREAWGYSTLEARHGRIVELMDERALLCDAARVNDRARR